MNLYTSNSNSILQWKSYLSIMVTIVTIAVIELLLYLFHPYDPAVTVSDPILHMAYYKPIRPERLIALAKFKTLVGTQAEFVQIGDSSGFVSIKPSIVNSYLPNGWAYLNTSLQVPAQFEGIATLGERALAANPKRKYLVGIFSMFHFGSRDDGFGDAIYLSHNSSWRHLFNLPSLKYRGIVTNFLYYFKGPKQDSETLSHLQNLEDAVSASSGWIGVDMRTSFTPHSCNVIRFEPILAMERLESLYTLAQKYGVKLVMVLGPVKCDSDETVHIIEKVFAQFHQKHPDVIMPLPIYNRIPEHYLGDEVHVTSKEGTEYYSKLFGESLQAALK